MLTIKHISLSGDEMLYLSPAANYTPERNRPDSLAKSNGPYSPATVWIDERNDGHRQPLTGGTVFVMNDKGSTVARYDLGASMVPLDADGARYAA